MQSDFTRAIEIAELLPCPFCGGAAKIGASEGNEAHIYCGNEDCKMPFLMGGWESNADLLLKSDAFRPSFLAAAEAWNRRALTPPAQPALAKERVTSEMIVRGLRARDELTVGDHNLSIAEQITKVYQAMRAAAPVAGSRDAIIDECGRICDIAYKTFCSAGCLQLAQGAAMCATKIRALKSTVPPSQQEGE